MNEGTFFQDLAILMIAAGLIGAIFSRLKWPKVLGYILAGVIMSPHTWGGGFLQDARTISTIGELGVIFLMFGMGLSFSARELKRIQSVALPAAIFDTVMMIWLGYTLGTRLLGWSAAQSLFLGVAICDSATTLLAKVIDEMGWGKRQFTKYVLGTSVCEDIICVGAIAVATGFANGGTLSAGSLFCSLGWLAVFFLSVLVFGFILVPPALQALNRRHDGEALLLMLLAVCFFVSYIAYRFEFSLALGAFLVGIIASSSEAKPRLEALADPLKTMFSSVFFVSIGLLVNPTEIWHQLPVILLISAVVIIGKFLHIALASLATGLSIKTSIQNGMGLAQIGEFAFMVAILYAEIKADTNNPMFQIAVGVSLLTTILNPTMIRLSDKIGDFADRRAPLRLKEWLRRYRGWLDKIGSSENSPSFILLKASAIRLGVYAVLILAVSAICSILHRFDYARFSSFFEKYDAIFFFILANLFTISLMPLVVSASRALGDEVAALLVGDGDARWQTYARQVVRTVSLIAVLVLFFVEWTMINVALAPNGGVVQMVVAAMILAVGIVGWRFFLKAGRQATKRLQEALTAEERREGLVKTMTVAVPEGAVHRLKLEAGSPAIGGTVVTLDIRAKTGASVVSVYRDGEITRNIGPEWEFCEGDVLVALGDVHQIAELKKLLGIVK